MFMAKMWNPWRGCHKMSEGCKFCYIHLGDVRKGINTDDIVQLEKFTLPIDKKKSGAYKVPSGELVYVCFSTDFLLEEADEWRKECWDMIHERKDLHFLFLTKRIERFLECTPSDWKNGYDNVTVGVSVSTQKEVDDKISILSSLPIKHKDIILQPLIEPVDISKYLDDIELVVVGGEYGTKARPLNYDWVLNIRQQCIDADTPFEFRQCGTHFIKDKKTYKLKYKELTEQARKANINTN